MPFDFNAYSSLLLPAILHGFLFAALLFIRGNRENRVADTLLAWLVLLQSITVSNWMLGFAGWYDSHDAYSTFMFYFPFNNLWWKGPLLYFYFRSLTNADFRITKKHWPHLILPLLALSATIIKSLYDILYLHIWKGRAFPEHFGTKGAWADVDRADWITALGYFVFLYYAIRTWREFRAYPRYLDERFSNTTDLEYRWLRRLLLALMAIMIIYLLFNIVNLFIDLSYKQVWLSYFMAGLLIYYISISGYYSNPPMYHELNYQADTPELAVDPIAPVPLSLPSDEPSLVDRFMQEEKPYLDPDLSLQTLSQKMGLPANQISKLVNETSGMNFNDYVNRFRIEHFKQSIEQGQHRQQTLLALAFDAGFNSKATFNRAFKKLTGQTPREYVAGVGSAGKSSNI